jgi:TonB family protein
MVLFASSDNNYSYSFKLEGESFTGVIFFSVLFHLFVLIGIPLIASLLLYRSEKYERPQTFTLVNMSNIIQKASVASKPKASGINPIPAKTKKKVAEEQKKDDINELNELLDALPAHISDISAGSSFKYSWYINSIISKVEERWKPPRGLTNKKDVSVTLFFSVFSDGNISEVIIKKSSGISTLDNIAVSAVVNSAPFGKLPVGYRENKLDITYILHYLE